MEVFIYLIGSPDCEDLKKNICGKVIFGVPEIGGFRGVVTFKKAEMAKNP